MKADLAIYTHVLGVPGQYESVALMLSHKMDFNSCANIGTVFANPVTYTSLHEYAPDKKFDIWLRPRVTHSAGSSIRHTVTFLFSFIWGPTRVCAWACVVLVVY